MLKSFYCLNRHKTANIPEFVTVFSNEYTHVINLFTEYFSTTKELLNTHLLLKLFANNSHLC